MIEVKLLNKDHELLDGALQNYFKDINCNVNYKYEGEYLYLKIFLPIWTKCSLDMNDFIDNFKHVIV